MSSAYAIVKGIHVALVFLSVTVFALRGLVAVFWPNAARHIALRRISILIDSGLLLAALVLLVILQFVPLGMPWMWTKLGLLVVYIVLGHQAFQPRYLPLQRLGFYVIALLCFVAMLSVAQHHHPLGALAGLGG